MGAFEWKESWVEILAQQEAALQYSEFTRQTALELGLKITQLVQQRG